MTVKHVTLLVKALTRRVCCCNPEPGNNSTDNSSGFTLFSRQFNITPTALHPYKTVHSYVLYYSEPVLWLLYIYNRCRRNRTHYVLFVINRLWFYLEFLIAVDSQLLRVSNSVGSAERAYELLLAISHRTIFSYTDDPVPGLWTEHRIFGPHVRTRFESFKTLFIYCMYLRFTVRNFLPIFL